MHGLLCGVGCVAIETSSNDCPVEACAVIMFASFTGIKSCCPLLSQTWLASDQIQRCGAASTNHTRQHHRWRGMCGFRVGYHRGFSSYAVCELLLFLCMCSLSRSVPVSGVDMRVLMCMTVLQAGSASTPQLMAMQMKAAMMTPNSDSML